MKKSLPAAEPVTTAKQAVVQAASADVLRGNQEEGGLNLTKMIRGLLKQDGISEENFVSWARVEAGVESATLEALVVDAAQFVNLCQSKWSATVTEIKGGGKA